jgi:hypothetical protein
VKINVSTAPPTTDIDKKEKIYKNHTSLSKLPQSHSGAHKAQEQH